MRVLGIDPSLTSLGYSYLADDGFAEVGRIRPKNMNGFDRIRYIVDIVESVVDMASPELVAFEGYAMGRFVGRAWDRIELCGVLKLSLYRRKIPLLVVPPSSLKLFATGKGNAEKEQVMKEMAKLYGRLFGSSDEADAYALMHLGMAHGNRRLLPRDRKHYKHAALRGCELIVSPDV